ncbi:MAG: hypothetical protein QN168_03055 [Armatimonadota bacterium]|nr:hypothetical protein [Armatimonadota bacterium]
MEVITTVAPSQGASTAGITRRVEGEESLGRLGHVAALVPAAGLVLLALAGAANLRLTFDEAFNITVSRNLVLRGIYGTATYNQIRPFDPAISTGPTVLVPVAIALRLGGLGVIQSRVAPVLLFGIFLLVVFRLHRGTPMTPVAQAITVLLLFPSGIFQEAARVLGEVPAFAFTGFTAILLGRAASSQHGYAAAGGMAALAVMAKPLAFPIAVSGVVAIALTRPRQFERNGVRRAFAACLLYIIPFAIPVLYWIVIPRMIDAEYASIRAALMTQQSVFSGRIAALEEAIKRIGALSSPLLALLMVVGGLDGVFIALRRRDPAMMFLSLTFLGYLGWWLIIAPTPGRRFALYWLWIGAVFGGCLAARATDWLMITTRPRLAARVRPLVAAGVFVFATLAALVSTVRSYHVVSAQRTLLEEQLALVRFARGLSMAGSASTARIYGYQWYMPWIIPALSSIEVGEFERDWLWSKQPHAAYLVLVPEIQRDVFVRTLASRAASQFGAEPSVLGSYTILRIVAGKWLDRLVLCPIERDLLAELPSGTVRSFPSALEDPRGRFRYPLTLGWRVGWEENLNITPLRPAVAMITRAELHFSNVVWRPDLRVLLGVLRPPESSDGFTLRASIIAVGRPEAEIARFVFRREAYHPNEAFAYALTPPLPYRRGEFTLKVELLPEPGRGDSDWAFVSPLVVVRAPDSAKVSDCVGH